MDYVAPDTHTATTGTMGYSDYPCNQANYTCAWFTAKYPGFKHPFTTEPETGHLPVVPLAVQFYERIANYAWPPPKQLPFPH